MGVVIQFPTKFEGSVTEPADEPYEYTEEEVEQFDRWREGQYNLLADLVLSMEDADRDAFFATVKEVRAVLDVWEGSG